MWKYFSNTSWVRSVHVDASQPPLSRWFFQYILPTGIQYAVSRLTGECPRVPCCFPNQGLKLPPPPPRAKYPEGGGGSAGVKMDATIVPRTTMYKHTTSWDYYIKICIHSYEIVIYTFIFWYLCSYLCIVYTSCTLLFIENFTDWYFFIPIYVYAYDFIFLISVAPPVHVRL